MATTEYMSDWTPEEHAEVQRLGLPPNVAVGYVARRRGTDVTDVHNRYDSLRQQMDDLINHKANGGGKMSEADLREAFEKFSASMPSRTQEKDQ
jgi:hypothetical protein